MFTHFLFRKLHLVFLAKAYALWCSGWESSVELTKGLVHRNQPQNPQKAGGFGILLELYKIILVFENHLHRSKPFNQNDMSN